MLVITHYQRLLDYIVPDFVHVLADGRIVRSGGKELALELEEKGYAWLEAGGERSRARDRIARAHYRARLRCASRRGSGDDEPAWLHRRCASDAIDRFARDRAFPRRATRTGATRTSRRRATALRARRARTGAGVTRADIDRLSPPGPGWHASRLRQRPVRAGALGAAGALPAGVQVGQPRRGAAGAAAPSRSNLGSLARAEEHAVRRAQHRLLQRRRPGARAAGVHDRGADPRGLPLGARSQADDLPSAHPGAWPSAAGAPPSSRTTLDRAGRAYFTNAVTRDRRSARAPRSSTTTCSARALGRSSTWRPLRVQQERDSSYESHSVSLGARSRATTSVALLDGNGAECTLNGLYVVDGRAARRQPHDASITRSPTAPAASSTRACSTSAARGVFNGRSSCAPGRPEDRRQADQPEPAAVATTPGRHEAAARDLRRRRQVHPRRDDRPARRGRDLLPAVARHRPRRRADAADLRLRRRDHRRAISVEPACASASTSCCWPARSRRRLERGGRMTAARSVDAARRRASARRLPDPRTASVHGQAARLPRQRGHDAEAAGR